MPIKSKKPEFGSPFKKNEVVSATADLPGVPKGTKGKVKVLDGITWKRYWVFFENGIDVGQLDSDDLVRPAHWDRYFEHKAEQQAAAERAAQAATSATEAGGSGGGDPAAADPNDPLAAIRAMVPAHLLERSRLARERLGA